MIGHAFMGRAHSQAWHSASRFFDIPIVPEAAVLCGRDLPRAEEAAARLGWAEAADDWRAVVERPDIDVVDICTPGDAHAPIAIAALAAGKHVICEKPLANSTGEAVAMAAAAQAARRHGALAMVGFTYRRVPAIALARQLVEEGRLGTVRHVRAQYLQDWLVDPEEPMSWRLDRERAGSGALGDIGAHVVDLAQHLLDDRIVAVAGELRTFVDERPLPGGGVGRVSVDDATAFLATFGGGALGVFEATRVATGRKNAIRLEVNGSRGSIAFDFEDMNVLWWHDAVEASSTQGFRRILVTEAEHPYLAGWWPPGHGLGYEHAFTHQVVDLLQAIATGTDPTPDFAAGLQVQRVLDAVATSATTRAWQSIDASDREELRP